MKSTVDKVDGLLRKLNIEVPAEKVQSSFDRVYKDIQKNATIKGFRKGKAPLATIKSIYEERVKQDVLNDIISESYQHALDTHSLEPIGYPKIHFDKFADEGIFSYSAEFEIRPEVKMTKYEGLEIQTETVDVTEKQVNDILENIRQGQAQTSPLLIERPLQEGDVAEIDFSGMMDGAPLEGGSGEGRHLEIGAKQFIPGFEEGLVGMSIGQTRELNLEFPKDYHAAEIAGKSVKFTVSLKGIKKKELPELNDEFATRVGKYANLEALKEAIRNDVKASEEKRVRDELRNNVLKELVNKNPVQVPAGLLAQQKQMIINDVHERMQQQGMSEQQFEEYKQKWDQDFEQSAAFMVQSTFLVDFLAEKLGLKATPQDIEAKIDEYTRQTGIEREKVAEFYNKSERRSRLSFQITEERVVNHLIDKAKITQKSP